MFAHFELPVIKAVIGDRVYIAQGVDYLPQGNAFHHFKPHDSGFESMNISCIIQFTELLQRRLEAFPTSRIIYSVEHGQHAMTNAVFLLGSYMILTMDMTTTDVVDCFDWMHEAIVKPFSHECNQIAGVAPSIQDCWQGLEKGRLLGWVRVPNEHEPEENWGELDIEEFRHYDSPCNGSFHEIIPRELIAFQCHFAPCSMDTASHRDDCAAGVKYLDDECGRRNFAAEWYAPIFREDFQVHAVVQLGGDSTYDAAAFLAHDIAVHRLELSAAAAASPPPPASTARAFLAAADAARAAGGALAVHAGGALGEGRSGALVALQLVLRHGFPARAAAGWLRILRPALSMLAAADWDWLAVAAASAAAGGPPSAPRSPLLKECGGADGASPRWLGRQGLDAELARLRIA